MKIAHERLHLASPAENRHEDPSLITAVVDALDAGQRIVLDRIELAVVDASAGARSALASFALVLAGLGLLLVGWIATNAVGILILDQYLTSSAAIGAAAVVNFLFGAAALLLARRRGIAAGAELTDRNGHGTGAAARGAIA